MAIDHDDFTIGVEEEFLLLDPATRHLRPTGDEVRDTASDAVGDEVQAELHLSQLETTTPVCRTLSELRRELVRLRRELMNAAERAGHRVGAAGTHPFSHWGEDRITPKEPYVQLEEQYQQLAREKIICGCHVHVGVGDAEDVVVAMNGARLWLAPLLALSSNSPFWMGDDTGYASYRAEISRRSPLSGIPPAFDSRARYDDLVEVLMTADHLDNPERIHWDLRPSTRYPTLEFRATDVCLTVDEAVMVAGLAKGTTRASLERAKRGERFPRPPRELLRLAMWQAARYGVDGELVDMVDRRSAPALEVIKALLDMVRPVLEDSGEWEEVSTLVNQTLDRGTAAARQRRAFESAKRPEDVVDLIVAETANA